MNDNRRSKRKVRNSQIVNAHRKQRQERKSHRPTQAPIIVDYDEQNPLINPNWHLPYDILCPVYNGVDPASSAPGQQSSVNVKSHKRNQPCNDEKQNQLYGEVENLSRIDKSHVGAKSLKIDHSTKAGNPHTVSQSSTDGISHTRNNSPNVSVNHLPITREIVSLSNRVTGICRDEIICLDKPNKDAPGFFIDRSGIVVDAERPPCFFLDGNRSEKPETRFKDKEQFEETNRRQASRKTPEWYGTGAFFSSDFDLNKDCEATARDPDPESQGDNVLMCDACQVKVRDTEARSHMRQTRHPTISLYVNEACEKETKVSKEL